MCLFPLLALCASAQPRFEVSSVRPSDPVLNQVRVGFTMDKQQVHITALPLSYYIRIAYEVKGSQVFGPPNLQDRFDITATLPDGVKQDKLPEMLQGLLNDRFQLKFHRESREMQVYVIFQGRGPLKLKEVAETPPDPNEVVTAGGSGSAQGISVNLGNGSSFTFANRKWEGKKLTLTQVADQLEQFVDRPVVDQTNLKGSYDFMLEIALEDYQAMGARASLNAGFPLSPQVMQRLEGAQFPTLFEAFEKLGLKLEPKKLAQPILVVDSISKVPTEN
jgi:uncharacterized protein (TIGR03435 family)